MTDTDAPTINFTLLEELATKPHKLLNIRTDGHHHDCCPWDGEVMQAARTAHHLLDLAGIPQGERYYSRDLDARTYLAVTRILKLEEQMGRISGWHSRESGPAGTVGDFCNECGNRWPCDTRRMVDGTYVNEDSA